MRSDFLYWPFVTSVGFRGRENLKCVQMTSNSRDMKFESRAAPAPKRLRFHRQLSVVGDKRGARYRREV
jgi:hypothetical protein